ncbi:hypothetical protein RISK_005639 [Rhodopirellula islandica]|uniref:Uncharacterized protein n=1 Tax=Rhodopirellula islandica TaxID=595434 RepID=A0A0J1B7M8_RHOIS|nr:hypothetical protein RISK_005639 [Rhodopirellula islandica]
MGKLELDARDDIRSFVRWVKGGLDRTASRRRSAIFRDSAPFCHLEPLPRQGSDRF